MKTLSLALLIIVSVSPYAVAQEPTFDCAKAGSEAEQLVCRDAGLAALDRTLAEVYAYAGQTLPVDSRATLRATQRGWLKGRDDCWKADDVRSCVELSYRTRIVELQIQVGRLEAPTPVEYACNANDRPFTAAFYRATDPPSAVLTYGNDQTIAFVAPSGSGARYTAENVEFWEHQGEATIDWYGTELRCKAAD